MGLLVLWPAMPSAFTIEGNDMRIQIHKKLTPRDRLRYASLYWGAPFTAVEVLLSWGGWGSLLLAVPIFLGSTAIAYFTGLLLVKVGESFTSSPR